MKRRLIEMAKEIKKSWNDFAARIAAIEDIYNVKCSFQLTAEMISGMNEEAPAETPAKDPAPKEEKKTKKRAKKETKKEEKRTPITEDTLADIDDRIAEVFEIPDDVAVADDEDGKAMWNQICKEFDAMSDAELSEEDKDEIFSMLSYLEENPDADIEDAKRPSK